MDRTGGLPGNSAALPNNLPRKNYDARNEAGTERQSGSLDLAFNAVNDELGMLEAIAERLNQRLSPVLEAAGPTSQAEARDPERSRSGFAQGVMEYAGRIRNVRRALEESVDRLSF